MSWGSSSSLSAGTGPFRFPWSGPGPVLAWSGIDDVTIDGLLADTSEIGYSNSRKQY